MNILEKRPLSLILCVMLGGFSLFVDFSIQAKLILAFSILLVFGLTFIFPNLIKGREVLSRIGIICLAISILLSALWSYIFYPEEYNGKNVQVDGTVYQIDNSDSNTSVLVIKTCKIQGKRDHHTLLVYMEKSMSKSIKLYDVVTIDALIYTYSPKSDDDTKSYCISSGYSGYLTNAKNLEIKGNRPDNFNKFFNSISLKLSNTLKKQTNFETGAFLSALIFGNKRDLDGNTRLNFSRIGISHILALSGMHLAILSSALNKFLAMIRLNKKYRVIISSIAIVIYIILTGASPSVMRAGIMLLITGILYMLSSKSDSITSLIVAVTVILVISPVSVYDLSLWLSAFATLGVIIFSEMNNSESEVKNYKKIISAIKNGCMVSVFAFGATFAISALRFGSFSIISIFSTLIFAFLLEILIYAGLLVLLIGRIIPIGIPTIVLSDATKELAEMISSIKWIQVSSDSFIVKLFIILFTIVFFAFVILETKKKKICVMLILALLATSFLAGEATTLISRYDTDIVYAPSALGDSFLMKSDGDVTLVYSGKSYEDSAYSITEFLADEMIMYLDNLILASYSYSTVSWCEKLADSIKIDKIIIPAPITKEEINIGEGLSELLSLYGTDLRYYKDLEKLEFGKYSYKLYGRNGYQYGVMPSNVFVISDGNASYTYLSVCKYENLNTDSKMLLYNSQNLFIGTLGNSKYYLFDMHLPKIKCIYYGDQGRISESAREYYSGKDIDMRHADSCFSIYE